jgi:hypothetical protein
MMRPDCVALRVLIWDPLRLQFERPAVAVSGPETDRACPDTEPLEVCSIATAEERSMYINA